MAHGRLGPYTLVRMTFRGLGFAKAGSSDNAGDLSDGLSPVPDNATRGPTNTFIAWRIQLSTRCRYAHPFRSPIDTRSAGEPVRGLHHALKRRGRCADSGRRRRTTRQTRAEANSRKGGPRSTRGGDRPSGHEAGDDLQPRSGHYGLAPSGNDRRTALP